MEKSFITILNASARSVQALPKKAVHTAKQGRYGGNSCAEQRGEIADRLGNVYYS